MADDSDKFDISKDLWSGYFIYSGHNLYIEDGDLCAERAGYRFPKPGNVMIGIVYFSLIRYNKET